MGRLNTPLGYLIVTTPTMSSFPGCMSVITAFGQRRGAVLSSLSRTRSPGCRLGDFLCQRWSFCRLWRLSKDQRCQNCCNCCWYVCHLEILLHLTSLKSAAGNWVSGSPIRKCPGDKEVGLKGSSDKTHRGLEFRQAYISARNVHSSS